MLGTCSYGTKVDKLPLSISHFQQAYSYLITMLLYPYGTNTVGYYTVQPPISNDYNGIRTRIIPIPNTAHGCHQHRSLYSESFPCTYDTLCFLIERRL